MALVVSYSNAVQGVSSDGTKRWVEATVDFDTGTYVTGGTVLPLAPLGLKEVLQIHMVLVATDDNFSTDAGKITAAWWHPVIDLTNTSAPKLLFYNNNQHSVSAVNAAVQYRFRFYGT